jgi:hypothetical protein
MAWCEKRKEEGQKYSQKGKVVTPFGPRLQALFLNKDIIELLDYRTTNTPGEHPDSVSDVFNGKLYRELCKKFFQVNGQTFDHKYFKDKHDITLSLSLDGFPIFNKRNLSTWPVILINFSLPPNIHTHLTHLLCYGVIPSPKAIKAMDSFLHPLYCELAKFTRGVKSSDLCDKKLFVLHVFFILIFGDMPAIAKVMQMKGHNGFCPAGSAKFTRFVTLQEVSTTSHFHILMEKTLTMPRPSKIAPTYC